MGRPSGWPGSGADRSEPGGPAVCLVFGAECLREKRTLASGTDDLDRDQDGPDDQRLPALQRQQNKQKCCGSEDVDGMAEPGIKAVLHQPTCVGPDGERSPELATGSEPQGRAD